MAETDLAALVGRNISERRRRLGLSQKELAARLQITQDAMARMEGGKIAPKMGRLQNIADTLECTVPYLFRSHDDGVEERAARIGDFLLGLPDEGQEALVDLVATTSSLIRKSLGQG